MPEQIQTTTKPKNLRWIGIIAGALLLLYVFLAVSASRQKSNTFDEAVHLTTGYLYWSHPEEKLWPENGIFAQAWAALPLLFDHLSLTPHPGAPSMNMGQWEQGYQFLYKSGNNPDFVLFQARFMISLLGALLGFLVYSWSKELFGPKAGLVSLFLFVFCPTMLAHGALVTADMAASLGFFAATYTFWKLSRRITLQNLLLSFLALGCLALAKLSSFLIVPVFLMVWLVIIFSWRPVEISILALRPRKIETRWSKAGLGALLLVAHALAVVAILWLGYRFNYHDWGQEGSRRAALEAPGFSVWTAQSLKILGLQYLNEKHLLPPPYIEGLSLMLSALSRGGYLMGTYHKEGSIWFFPVAFLIKTPVSTLILFLLSFMGLVFRQKPKPVSASSPAKGLPCPGLYDLAPLLILGGVYGLACIFSRLNVGHRHMMPIYPVLFVLSGASIFWLVHPKMLFRILTFVLLAGVAFESLSVRPHYLAFFNQFIGGPQRGYRYLADSSLDWGQDLPGLGRWLDHNPSANGESKTYFSYFGTGDPEYYGIKALRLPDRFRMDKAPTFSLQPGTYCISATYLHEFTPLSPIQNNLYLQTLPEIEKWTATVGNPEARDVLIKQQSPGYWESLLKTHRQLQFIRLLEYLRHRDPDAEVGYSILIFHLSERDLGKALIKA